MSTAVNGESRVPPGFRFHPTDEELVDYYLRKKIDARSIDLDVIREVDLYKIEPWDLSDKCQIGSTEENEWYFFSHKDKKYPTGTRTNRSTTAGFWKATGRDKAIYSKHKLVGMRKTLVFYRGRAPNGQKSDWIMHEYRLENCDTGYSQEEGWVVCRVFRKKCPTMRKSLEQDPSCSFLGGDHILPDFDSFNHFCQEDILFYGSSDPISCKQEVELGFPLFKHMPSLESPTAAFCPHDEGIKRALMENEKKRVDGHFSCLEKLSNSSHQVHPIGSAMIKNYNEQKQQQAAAVLTDWRVLDRLVASQLSSENASKVAVVARQNETHHPTKEQMASALHNSFSQNDEYHNSNDADLWVFAKRNL